jgi:hypothetical protein
MFYFRFSFLFYVSFIYFIVFKALIIAINKNYYVSVSI